MAEERSLDMDAVTAHLDRGWDLLGRGDTMAARVSAHHILKIDGDSPEGHTLLGAIAAAEGEPEEAIELFRRALDVDPDYLDAMLYAAELAIHPLGEVDYALQLCGEAEELAEGPEELLDVRLLQAEAAIATGRDEQACQAADRLPPPPYSDPAYYLRVGRLLLDLDRRAEAIPLLTDALEHDGSRLDAHYFLGVALELEGSPREALDHLLAVHQLDREQPEVSWARAPDDFRAVVEGALAALPDKVGEWTRAALLQIVDYPPLELVAEGFDPRAAVFFAGVPAEVMEQQGEARRRRKGQKKPKKKPAEAEPEATCVFVYKRNVERFAGSAESVGQELHAALRQEAAFFFGVDVAEIAPSPDGRRR